MAESALALLTDAERWARFSAAARQRAVDNFSIDEIVPMYEDYYREVIERGRIRERRGA